MMLRKKKLWKLKNKLGRSKTNYKKSVKNMQRNNNNQRI